jgi:hypothetical protein
MLVGAFFVIKSRELCPNSNEISLTKYEGVISGAGNDYGGHARTALCPR